MHFPPWHGDPSTQALPHFPQFAGSVVKFEQDVPQGVCPDRQGTHLPFWQMLVDGQAFPQLPQLPASVSKSAHWPLQQVESPPQAMPQAPQFAESVFKSEQVRKFLPDSGPQAVKPFLQAQGACGLTEFAGHEHRPSWHVWGYLHAFQQAPQFSSSVRVSVQNGPQSVSPAGQ
jgi:hypothetical protein